ncbi:hypothetical protein [Acuticoccus sediminis]|uniref:hypothetical protein n=1 Tax=Acuticoccus sediminis TaxID=2184697 RepID=UPI001CFE1E9B|nr:hypothetical protein [Acuticoccus sediminis]
MVAVGNVEIMLASPYTYEELISTISINNFEVIRLTNEDLGSEISVEFIGGRGEILERVSYKILMEALEIARARLMTPMADDDATD